MLNHKHHHQQRYIKHSIQCYACDKYISQLSGTIVIKSTAMGMVNIANGVSYQDIFQYGFLPRQMLYLSSLTDHFASFLKLKFIDRFRGNQ